MTFLHVGFLLPFLSLFAPFPFAAGLSLDEAFVLLMLPVALLMTPWNAIKPAYKLLGIVTVLSIINLSLFLLPKNFAIQFINVLSFFTFFLFALHRIKFSLERVLSIYFSVLKFYLIFGFLQIPWYYVDTGSLLAFTRFMGQPDTSAVGLIGLRFLSLLQEPSHFTQFAAFGYVFLFITWLNGGTYRHFLGMLVIGMSLILTRSALASVPLLLPLIIVAIQHIFTRKGALIVVVVACSIAAERVVGIIPEEVIERFVDLFSGLSATEQKLVGNASSGSLVHAIDIARQTILDTYGSGIGFGSYQEAFLRYTPDDIVDRLYNRVSGGSLLIRIGTEFGVIGTFIWVFAILFKYPFSAGKNIPQYGLRIGCLAILMVSMVRLGGYTTGIFPFAVIGYFCWKKFGADNLPTTSKKA